jgi:proteasome lid subunit RPN8/RPN11
MPNNKITLSHQARMDIAHYVRHCDYEIGGFGYVTMNDAGNFYVDKIFLVEQEVSPAAVDFADAGLAYAIDKAANDDRLNDLKFCWHSHVDMGAFWSSTDDEMIANMNNGLTPYLVSLVQNKKGEHEQRVDFFPKDEELRDFTEQIQYDLDLYYELAPIPEHITKSYDELVTVDTWEKRKKGSPHANTVWKRPISEARQDYLFEKCAKDGYDSLSDLEARDYDEMLDDLAMKHAVGGGAMWDDYDFADDKDYLTGSCLKDTAEKIMGKPGIDDPVLTLEVGDDD